ncbi:MAG: DUF5398 family protein [Parachlamydiales bacterium]|jgi:hypothetical protein
MYGLKKNTPQNFNFDLEVEINKNPGRKKEILTEASKHLEEIKGSLRNPKCQEAKSLSEIAEGYDALKKVIGKLA